MKNPICEKIDIKYNKISCFIIFYGLFVVYVSKLNMLEWAVERVIENETLWKMADGELSAGVLILTLKWCFCKNVANWHEFCKKADMFGNEAGREPKGLERSDK